MTITQTNLVLAIDRVLVKLEDKDYQSEMEMMSLLEDARYALSDLTRTLTSK